MKKNYILLFIIYILMVLNSCEVKNDPFLTLPVWERIEPLMVKTESVIRDNDWMGILSRQNELKSGFSELMESLREVKTENEEYSLILGYQINGWERAGKVFSGDLSDLENISGLVETDKNNEMTSAIVDKLEERPQSGFFYDLSKSDNDSNNITTWGTRLLEMLQIKMLTGKEIKNEKDIKVIKAVIARTEKEGRLDELKKYLEKESSKDKVPPSVLFSLSLVYGKKGLVKEEYRIIEKLEEKVKSSPKIAFNLALVYGRKELLKSKIDKAEAEALALTRGYISVSSIPNEAEVYINGEKAGRTPYSSGMMGEGRYKVELRKTDYTAVEKEVFVKAGETAVIDEKLMLKPGSLEVKSTPYGSIVYIDGEEIGVTPVEIPSVEPGSHEVLIKREGYQNRTESVDITPGSTVRIAGELIALKGEIVIRELSYGSDVYLDGNRVYPTGGRLSDVTAGDHSVLIKKEGFKKRTVYVTMSPGGKEYISGKLERESFKLPYASIKVDGRNSDWKGIDPIVVDALGDNGSGPAGTDIEKVYLATDGTYLYTMMIFADGAPAKKPLFYAIGLDNTDRTDIGLLFTQYNGKWQTGFDRWTDKNSGFHKMVSKGTVKARAGIIECRYKLKEIGFVLDKPVLVNAWDDSSGGSYDNTSSAEIVWTNHYRFFTAEGTVRSVRINERTVSPRVYNLSGDKMKILLYTDESDYVGLEFLTDKIKPGNHTVKEGDYDIHIYSSIINRSEGYFGNRVSGKFNIFENNSSWISGYYKITSNIGDKLSGFFSIEK